MNEKEFGKWLRKYRKGNEKVKIRIERSKDKMEESQLMTFEAAFGNKLKLETSNSLLYFQLTPRKVWGWRLPEELYKTMLEVSIKKAESKNYQVILLRHWDEIFGEEEDKKKKNLLEMGFVKVSYNSDAQKWELVESFEEKKSNAWLYEVRPGAYFEMISIEERIDSFFEKKKEEDATITHTIRKQFGSSSLSAAVYYKGKDFNIGIIAEKVGYLLTTDTGYERKIENPEDVVKALKVMLEEIEEETKLLNLVEPPRKHFNAAFRSMMISQQSLDSLYNQLSNEYGAIELEKLFAEGTDIDDVCSKFDTYMIRLLNKFVIFNKVEAIIFDSEEVEKAFKFYEDTCHTIFTNTLTDYVKNAKLKLKTK